MKNSNPSPARSSALEDYRRMAKPRAIEEAGDVYLLRPLGFLLVLGLRHTPVTPTQVSVLGVLAGWATAWLYYASGRGGTDAGLALLAALAFLLHSVLDSADGQLARLTNRTSPVGRIVDGFCDNLTFGAIYVAIVAAYAARGGARPGALALLALAAAWSHSVQSSLVEYQRTLYLRFVHGKRDAADPPGGEAARGALARAMRAVFAPYHRQQRAVLRTTARTEERAAAWLAAHPGGEARLAAVWERRQRAILKPWALLASNSHKAGIVAASFVPAVAGAAGGGLGMGWYLLYDLALNLVMAGLIAAQARANRATLADLAGGPGGAI